MQYELRCLTYFSINDGGLGAQDVLESVTFSFEGGPNLNFAEGNQCCTCAVVSAVTYAELGVLVPAAALLIQGSACVYGKKVEYLHSLVYQALEFIAEKK